MNRASAHREAYTTPTKSQLEDPQIPSAYDAVAHWITVEGRRVAGVER